MDVSLSYIKGRPLSPVTSSRFPDSSISYAVTVVTVPSRFAAPRSAFSPGRRLFHAQACARPSRDDPLPLLAKSRPMPRRVPVGPYYWRCRDDVKRVQRKGPDELARKTRITLLAVGRFCRNPGSSLSAVRGHQHPASGTGRPSNIVGLVRPVRRHAGSGSGWLGGSLIIAVRLDPVGSRTAR